MTPADRIARLRAAMAQRQLAACVVLTSDPHVSEYIPEYWQARQWLTGFDGSAGTLVLTDSFAGLWVDSRYWEQAELDLAGTGISVMQWGRDNVADPEHWLAQNLASGQQVWLDFRSLSVQAHQRWAQALSEKGISLVGQPDLLEGVWPNRPALPANPVYQHVPPFACRTRAQNLAAVRQAMAEHNAQWHVVSSLDDIAWLFNLRGSDVPYNPVFLAHAMIGLDSATLFIDQRKVTAQVAHYLYQNDIEVQPYEALAQHLAALDADTTLLVNANTVTTGVLAAAQQAQLIQAPNPSTLLKACKNQAEIEQVRQTMAQDGAALCEFF